MASGKQPVYAAETGNGAGGVLQSSSHAFGHVLAIRLGVYGRCGSDGWVGLVQNPWASRAENWSGGVGGYVCSFCAQRAKSLSAVLDGDC